MVGISDIGVYLPEKRNNNFEKMSKFNIDRSFITDKIGFVEIARKNENEKASDLCVKAFENLTQHRSIKLHEIDFIAVCTQNGDYSIPQTSSIVQDKIKASKNCAAFDINLGCSGYVYSLHIAKSFMDSNGCKNGLLFTADPYSEIISSADKNTALLFGDAATVTLLTNEVIYNIKQADFSTFGHQYMALMKKNNSPLEMNGHLILNFCMSYLPMSIRNCILKNDIQNQSIDLFILHQASKYVIDRLSDKLTYDYPDVKKKMPFHAQSYGNTISSSIPIVLKDFLDKTEFRHIILSGFGVGLSIATSLITRQ